MLGDSSEPTGDVDVDEPPAAAAAVDADGVTARRMFGGGRFRLERVVSTLSDGGTSASVRTKSTAISDGGDGRSSSSLLELRTLAPVLLGGDVTDEVRCCRADAAATVDMDAAAAAAAAAAAR